MFSTSSQDPILPQGTVALTYDDGPGPQTLELAEFLSSKDIRATFFFVGKHVIGNEALIQRVECLGHTIGNHTFAHLKLTEIPSEACVIEQVVSGHVAIRNCTQKAPYLFRAPFGAWDSKTALTLRGSQELKGYHGHIHWNVGEADFMIGSHRNFDPSLPKYTFEECRAKYLISIRNKGGGTVLLHDWSADEGPFGNELRNNNRCVELTKHLVNSLKGFKFTGLDEFVPRL